MGEQNFQKLLTGASPLVADRWDIRVSDLGGIMTDEYAEKHGHALGTRFSEGFDNLSQDEVVELVREHGANYGISITAAGEGEWDDRPETQLSRPGNTSGTIKFDPLGDWIVPQAIVDAVGADPDINVDPSGLQTTAYRMWGQAEEGGRQRSEELDRRVEAGEISEELAVLERERLSELSARIRRGDITIATANPWDDLSSLESPEELEGRLQTLTEGMPVSDIAGAESYEEPYTEHPTVGETVEETELGASQKQVDEDPHQVVSDWEAEQRQLAEDYPAEDPGSVGLSEEDQRKAEARHARELAKREINLSRRAE